MDQKFLLPHSFKKPALIILCAAGLVLIYLLLSFLWYVPSDDGVFRFTGPYWDVLDIMTGNSLAGTMSLSLLMISLLAVSFTREKAEDEYIAYIRGASLIWAAFANSVFLAISFLLFYDGLFLYVCLANMFSYLLLFNIKFAVEMRRLRKNISNA